MNKQYSKALIALIPVFILALILPLALQRIVNTQEKQNLQSEASTGGGTTSIAFVPLSSTVQPGATLPVNVQLSIGNTPGNLGITAVKTVMTIANSSIFSLTPADIVPALPSPWNYVRKDVVTNGASQVITIEAVFISSGTTAYTASNPVTFATLNLHAATGVQASTSLITSSTSEIRAKFDNSDILSSITLPNGSYAIVQPTATPTPSNTPTPLPPSPTPSKTPTPMPTPTKTPTPTTTPSAVNQPPTVTTTFLMSANVGSTYSVPVNGTDPNAADTLTMNITNLPPGLVKSDCNNFPSGPSGSFVQCSISGSPTTAGTYQVSITVLDNHGGGDTNIVPLVISPNPTPTLIPTPTVTVTPTQMPPPPTPAIAIVNFGVVFQGINSLKPNKTVNVELRQGSTVVYTFNNVNTTANSSGLFSGNLSGITPGTYTIFVKGPVHLRRKVTTTPVALASGVNSFNWNNTPLLIGDVDGDNDLELDDVSLIIGAWTSSDTPVTVANDKFDVDDSGFISLADVSWLISNWATSKVLGD